MENNSNSLLTKKAGTECKCPACGLRAVFLQPRIRDCVYQGVQIEYIEQRIICMRKDGRPSCGEFSTADDGARKDEAVRNVRMRDLDYRKMVSIAMADSFVGTKPPNVDKTNGNWWIDRRFTYSHLCVKMMQAAVSSGLLPQLEGNASEIEESEAEAISERDNDPGQDGGQPNWPKTGETVQKEAKPLSLQAQAKEWTTKIFGEESAKNQDIRTFRFLEEAIELGQANGIRLRDLIELAKSVYEKPPGQPKQEVGGVMLTLAALCNQMQIDMLECGQVEMDRCQRPEVIERIREKQKLKLNPKNLSGIDQLKELMPDALRKNLKGLVDELDGMGLRIERFVSGDTRKRMVVDEEDVQKQAREVSPAYVLERLSDMCSTLNRVSLKLPVHVTQNDVNQYRVVLQYMSSLFAENAPVASAPIESAPLKEQKAKGTIPLSDTTKLQVALLILQDDKASDERKIEALAHIVGALNV